MSYKFLSFSKTAINLEKCLNYNITGFKKWNCSDCSLVQNIKAVNEIQDIKVHSLVFVPLVWKQTSISHSAIDFLWLWQCIAIIIQTLLAIIYIKNISLHSYFLLACFTGLKSSLLVSFKMRMCVTQPVYLNHAYQHHSHP